MSTFDAVAAYHREHGDDYGSERSRQAKYDAIFSLADFRDKTVLDVGCGSGQFRDLLPASSDYTGIDLLNDENVLYETRRFQIVVANGIFYKIPDVRITGKLIRHMWMLAEEVLIFTSLSRWAPAKEPGELYLDPADTIRLCERLTTRIVFRHDYALHDFAVALYR